MLWEMKIILKNPNTKSIFKRAVHQGVLPSLNSIDLF